LQPNTSRLPQNALGRARWDDTQVNYWTRGDERALSFSNTEGVIVGIVDDDENIKQLLNLSTIFVVDVNVKVVLYL
jgi:hypothetical protein